MSLRTKIVFPFVTVFLSILAIGLLLEGVLRVWYFVHNKVEPPFSYRSTDLGWRPTANLSFQYERKGYGEISFSSTRDGFRRFDKLQTNTVKVLVVGDSFTQAYHVSNEKAYYDYLTHSNTPMEVFAFAAGGYGTVQQAMALQEYIPLISPDLIVWQFTGNDFINNDWLLESQSSQNSSHMRRPFFENGDIVYRHPDNTLGTLAEHSLLVRRFLVIRSSFRKRTGGSIEDVLNLDHPGLQRSVATTRQMIEKVARQYPDIPLIAFFAGKQFYSWELPAFAQVCELDVLRCITDITTTVRSASQNGEQVDGGRDGHWNETGHAIAGKILSQALSIKLKEMQR